MKQNKSNTPDLGPKRWFRRNKRKKQSMVARIMEMLRRKGLPKHVIQITVWETCHRSSEYSDTCHDDFHTVHEFSQQDYALETMWLEYVEQSESWEIKPEDCVSEFDFKTSLTSMGVFEDADRPEIGVFSIGDKSYYVDTKTRALYRFADILGQSHVYHRCLWTDEIQTKLRKKGEEFGDPEMEI